MKTRKINKIGKPLFVVSIIIVALITASSCSKESGNETGSELTGWYTNLNHVAKQGDFYDINTAINNYELLTSYSSNKYYATYDLFIKNDGLYHDSEPYFGKLRFSINTSLRFVHIIDESTLQMGACMLYVEDGSGTNSQDLVYKLYSGSVFGNMVYCGRLNYYTYVRTDNKIIISNGDIYTIINGGLVEDGSSSMISKYDPTKRY